MKKNVRQSLGRRFFTRMLCLILAITVLAFMLITFLLRVYIRADVSTRLDSMVSGLVTSGGGGEANLSDEELHGRGTQGNAFRLSADGEVLDGQTPGRGL